MKVYLALRTSVEYNDYDDGTYSVLNAIIYRTEQEAKQNYSPMVLKVDVKELPMSGIDFDVPTTTEKYRQWYQRNGKWANGIAPLIGKVRFTAPPRRKPIKRKGS